jgi:hypothetical protein
VAIGGFDLGIDTDRFARTGFARASGACSMSPFIGRGHSSSPDGSIYPLPLYEQAQVMGNRRIPGGFAELTDARTN